MQLVVEPLFFPAVFFLGKVSRQEQKNSETFFNYLPIVFGNRGWTGFSLELCVKIVIMMLDAVVKPSLPRALKITF